MDLRYFIDPDSGLPHIYGHGVTEQEAEYVIRHAPEDRPGSGDTRHAIGPTAAGRHLRVIYVPDDDRRGGFVVTAYEVRGKQLKGYRRRRRRKGGR